MNIILEYVIVFISVYLINYFMNAKNFLVKDKNKKNNRKNRNDDNKRPMAEVSYLKKIYGVNIDKLDYNKVIRICIFVNTFIITTIYIILIYLVPNLVLKLIIGLVLLILMTIICYGLLGRYFLWKEGDRDV